MRVKGTDECKNTFRRGRRYTVTVGKTLQHMRAAVHRVQGPAQWGGDSGGRRKGKWLCWYRLWYSGRANALAPGDRDVIEVLCVRPPTALCFLLHNLILVWTNKDVICT